MAGGISILWSRFIMAFRALAKAMVVAGAGLLVLGLVVVPHLLPLGVETLIHHQLKNRPVLDTMTVSVGHLGMTRAIVGPVTVGPHRVVDRLTATYTPQGLFRGRVDRLEISGLDIRVAVTGEGLTFMDMALPDRAGEAGAPGAFPLTALEIPAFVFARIPSRFAVTHGRIFFDLPEQSLVVPFDLTGQTEKDGVLSLSLALFPLGQAIRGTVFLEKRGRTGRFSLSARDISYGRWNDLIHWFAPEISLEGRGTLEVSGAKNGPWQMHLSRIALKNALPLTLENFDMTLVPEFSTAPDQGQGMALHGRAAFQVNMKGMPPLDLIGEAGLNPAGHWQLSLVRSPDSKNAAALQRFIPLGGGEVEGADTVHFKVDATGQGRCGTVSLSLNTGKMVHRYDDVETRILRMDAHGRGKFDFSTGGRGLDLHVEPHVSAMTARSGTGKVTFPRVALPLDMTFVPGEPLLLSGRVTARKGRAVWDGPMPVRLEKIAVDLPVCYPWRAGAQAGSVAVDPVFLAGHTVGPLRAKIAQGPGGITGSGFLTLDLFKGVGIEEKDAIPLAGPQLDFNLTAGPEGGTAQMTMPPLRLTRSMVHGTGWLSPDVSLPDFDVILGAEVRVTGNGKEFDGSGRLNLSDGRITLADTGIDISGIRTDLILDELFRWRSRPGRTLMVDRLKINRTVVRDIQLRYTLESKNALLLEAGAMKWCQGEVTLGATRFTSGQDAYHMELLCHRLRFADLLEQLGAFKARGEGSLNGRLPVTWTDAGLSVDNGYLYSTPGVGGSIQVTDTAALTAGIPVDSPQFAQLDLAREALKNYSYEWARVGMNSQGESLGVRMELDGRPENVLPFVFQKKTGGFVRVDDSRAGSRFQGIRLDVNLELPFNRMMKLGNRWHRLFQK